MPKQSPQKNSQWEPLNAGSRGLRQQFEQIQSDGLQAPEEPTLPFRPKKRELKLHHRAYRLLGTKTEPLYPIFESLKPALAQSGLQIAFRGYVSSAVLFTVSSVLLVLLVSLPTFMVFRIGPLLSLILAVSVGALVFLGFYMYPFYKRSARKERMEDLVAYTSSYLTILASAGLMPERIVRSASTGDEKLMLANEIMAIAGKTDVLGYDILSALESEIERSPSLNYANLLRGFAASIRTGGDMKNYFISMTRSLMAAKSERLRQFLSTLAMLAEVYVVMLVAFPLMLVAMFAVMAAVGGSLAGIGVFQIMYMMTFILIPAFGVLFIVLIDSIQPKG